jgi:hypothetical protein
MLDALMLRAALNAPLCCAASTVLALVPVQYSSCNYVLVLVLFGW